jgi:hypothetical protein
MDARVSLTSSSASGFSLFVLKAVLDGRGNEIIGLAKTNLAGGKDSGPRHQLVADFLDSYRTLLGYVATKYACNRAIHHDLGSSGEYLFRGV